MTGKTLTYCPPNTCMAAAWRDEHAPTETELVNAVKFMAYVILQYGEIYAPIFDRLQHELSEMRRQGGSPSDRARAVLDAMTPMRL